MEYRRDTSHSWIKYRDFRKKEIFSGNSNNNIAEIREIAQAIIAKQFRIYPIQINEKKSKRMCLRLELYGCLSTDHVISYSIPPGDRRSFDMDFSDKTYDSLLNNGVGQLIDGETGSDDIRIDTQSWTLRGFEWVGWKKTMKNRTSVTLKFSFDSIRNFSEIRLHTNNMFSKDIEQFRRINITSLIHENAFTNKQILIELSEDRQSEQARWINIPIKEQLGKELLIELTFGYANWVLISEIQFISTDVTDTKLLTELNGKNSEEILRSLLRKCLFRKTNDEIEFNDDDYRSIAIVDYSRGGIVDSIHLDSHLFYSNDCQKSKETKTKSVRNFSEDRSIN